VAPARHYGMDWLRIGAFALLILYHIGMFFVHWDWHVKTAQPLDWVAIPMLATNSWRIPLLFVVSGFASAIILARGGTPGRFMRERTARLIIPVIAAVIVIIPPQPWIELMVKHGYKASFPHFWLHDYFRFGALDGIILPTWQHLWFVVYLWVYTLLLALIPVRWLDRGTPVFDRIFGGIGLLLIPLAWGLLVALWFGRGTGITHALFDDITGHLTYVPAFLFGVGLASAPRVLSTARHFWKPALALALIAYAIVAAIEIAWPGNAVVPPPYLDIMRAARAVQGWAAIVALIGIADRFWNHDHRWRATLTEAVFPFYIIHQTIIVVLGWWLLQFALPAGVEFAILLVATVVGCFAFYGIGRTVAPLRPLIGLKRRRPVERAGAGL